ncbi:head-tail adaptor protein [Acidimangrovimonas sediminis]|uniref:head-tail adaptor protein n=1 Tax=Acidimangrovimonas sediminis TaxID=2056283 RepID=UPI000C802406|nr:head-tail adaptor protein [Acidimangrovimonas sediminis]
MSAVRLNRRLVLETAARAGDGHGGFRSGWTALGTVWAELRPGTGRESFGEAVTYARVPYRVIVRAAPPGAPARPVPGQRFREGVRIFTILAVAEMDAAGNFLTCFAREEVPA